MILTPQSEVRKMSEYVDYSKPSKERTFKYALGSFKSHPIYLTPEMGRKLINMERRVHQAQERQERCKIPSKKYGLVVCRAKCSECPLLRMGKTISLTAFEEYGDEPTEGEFGEMQRNEDPREIINKEERDARIHQIFNEIDPLAYEVLTLKFVDKLSMEEISKIVGIKRTTLNDKVKKWVSKLKAKESDLFENF